MVQGRNIYYGPDEICMETSLSKVQKIYYTFFLGTFLLVAFEAVSCCSSDCLLDSQSFSLPSKPSLSLSHKVLKCEVRQ